MMFAGKEYYAFKELQKQNFRHPLYYQACLIAKLYKARVRKLGQRICVYLTPVEFNLKAIVKEATTKLAETFPDAQEYLLSLCDEQLNGKLTSSELANITVKILEKVGFVEGEP